jgi:hypothetical protein
MKTKNINNKNKQIKKKKKKHCGNADEVFFPYITSIEINLSIASRHNSRKPKKRAKKKKIIIAKSKYSPYSSYNILYFFY